MPTPVAHHPLPCPAILPKLEKLQESMKRLLTIWLGQSAFL